MRLSLRKGGGFRVSSTNPYKLEMVSRIPTSRIFLKRKQATLAGTVEVWKVLRENLNWFDFITPKARRRLNSLQKEYKQNRIEIRKATREFKTEREIELPVPLKSNPYQHQIKAFGFSAALKAAALFMEQGTGKTLVAIALSGYRWMQNQVKVVLVVCPKSVIPVWKNELKKHADFDYQFLDRGKGELSTEKLNIVVFNYDLVNRRLKQILKMNPDFVILDEGHRIKNRKAKRSRSIHSLGKKVPFRLELSGTPLGTGIQDAWSQYKFLDESIFGSTYKDFQERYLKMGGYGGYEIKGYKNEGEFTEKLHSIAFRVTKEECLDLPGEIFQNLYCEPDRITHKLYRKLEKELGFEYKGETVEAELPIVKTAKFRQITGGIVRSDLGSLVHISKIKLEAVRDYIQDKDWNKKLVIFVAFTHELEMISDTCRELGKGVLTLDGRTSDRDRARLEKTFRQDSRYDILIAQIQAGSEGLDFTPADVAIFYSPTFSYIWYEQAKARLHRNNQDSPVTYLNVVMSGTIDEHIVESLESYGNTSRDFLDNRRTYRLRGSNMVKKTKTDKTEKHLDDVESEIKKEGLGGSQKAGKKKKKTKSDKKTSTKKSGTKKTSSKKADLKKKGSKKKASEKKDSASRQEGFTANDLAEEYGVDPKDMRKALREIGAKKPGNSWVWKGPRDPLLSPIRKELKGYWE